MMRAVLIWLSILLLVPASLAQAADVNPEAEVAARTERISKTLRCVVCQNQSIHDSNAPLAEDMRRLVEKRVRAGDSDDQVRAYLRERYGDFVLMSPPVESRTWLLWFGPGILVLGGLYWVWQMTKRKSADQAGDEGALSAADIARVNAALHGPDDQGAGS